jgi:hypothetical protein
MWGKRLFTLRKWGLILALSITDEVQWGWRFYKDECAIANLGVLVPRLHWADFRRKA